MDKKALAIYLLKFLGAFCFLFYGTEAIIGLSSPENSYNAFVADYLNFIDPFRNGLLLSSKAVLSLFEFDTFLSDKYTLRMHSGAGVRMVYSCIGYGVISFWLAFIFANNGTAKRKAAWMIGGSLILCLINIFRISLLLLATQQSWAIPLGLDHHTWFNIVAYLSIFTMIFFYDRNSKSETPFSKMEEVKSAATAELN